MSKITRDIESLLKSANNGSLKGINIASIFPLTII